MRASAASRVLDSRFPSRTARTRAGGFFRSRMSVPVSRWNWRSHARKRALVFSDIWMRGAAQGILGIFHGARLRALLVVTDFFLLA